MKPFKGFLPVPEWASWDVGGKWVNEWETNKRMRKGCLTLRSTSPARGRVWEGCALPRLVIFIPALCAMRMTV